MDVEEIVFEDEELYQDTIDTLDPESVARELNIDISEMPGHGRSRGLSDEYDRDEELYR